MAKRAKLAKCLTVSMSVSGGGRTTSFWPRTPSNPMEVETVTAVIVAINVPVSSIVTGGVVAAAVT